MQSVRGHLEDGPVAHFQVTLKVGFRLEDAYRSVSQATAPGSPARELLQRRKLDGDGGMEALRVLKRRLSDVVYRAMLTDQNQSLSAVA